MKCCDVHNIDENKNEGEREREIERKGLHGINAGICSLVHDEGKKEREKERWNNARPKDR